MKNTLTFTYQLTYDEAYEAFYLLSMKWSKKTRTILTVVLTIIAVCFLGLYGFNGKNISCFFLAIVDILLLSYLVYMPVLKARRGAEKVCSQRGTYKVELTENGRILTGKEELKITGDANARVIETAGSYILRPDGQHTFCIPKRIMNVQEQKETESILKSVCRYKKEQ